MLVSNRKRELRNSGCEFRNWIANPKGNPAYRCIRDYIDKIIMPTK